MAIGVSQSGLQGLYIHIYLYHHTSVSLWWRPVGRTAATAAAAAAAPCSHSRLVRRPPPWQPRPHQLFGLVWGQPPAPTPARQPACGGGAERGGGGGHESRCGGSAQKSVGIVQDSAEPGGGEGAFAGHRAGGTRTSSATTSAKSGGNGDVSEPPEMRAWQHPSAQRSRCCAAISCAAWGTHVRRRRRRQCQQRGAITGTHSATDAGGDNGMAKI
jgi:hypothetical protein